MSTLEQQIIDNINDDANLVKLLANYDNDITIRDTVSKLLSFPGNQHNILRNIPKPTGKDNFNKDVSFFTPNQTKTTDGFFMKVNDFFGEEHNRAEYMDMYRYILNNISLSGPSSNIAMCMTINIIGWIIKEYYDDNFDSDFPNALALLNSCLKYPKPSIDITNDIRFILACKRLQYANLERYVWTP